MHHSFGNRRLFLALVLLTASGPQWGAAFGVWTAKVAALSLASRLSSGSAPAAGNGEGEGAMGSFLERVRGGGAGCSGGGIRWCRKVRVCGGGVVRMAGGGGDREKGGESGGRGLLRVVGGVAVRGSTVFMAKRPEGKAHAGLWEFPGGKVEEGESDREALKRELEEELGVETSVGNLVGIGEDGKVELACYEVTMMGEPVMHEHQEMAWINLDSLSDLPVPPADVATIDALMVRHSDASSLSMVRASHIVVKHQGSRRTASWKDESGAVITKRSKEAAIKALMGYRDIIVEASDPLQKFGELAALHSDCGSAFDNGDLGFFGRGQMQKPFEDATFSLQVAEISGLVDTDSGVHIILRTG